MVLAPVIMATTMAVDLAGDIAAADLMAAAVPTPWGEHPMRD